MLVLDDGKLKLLKMKEKLLEVSHESNDETLSEYKDIVLDIDKELYASLVDMIKNTNYHNEPLEKKLHFLMSVESEYSSFNEFQCKCRNIYEKYANDKLDLSDINSIHIDKITEKIAAINGYLINSKNIDKNRKELEELNMQLIDGEKKKDTVLSKFKALEEDLKNNVLNAEGRVYNASGNSEYTSIEKEFFENGIDLKVLLRDKELLNQKLNDINDLVLSEEERMKAAEVCFNNMHTRDIKRLYDDSVNDFIRAKYQLVLLKLIDLVSKELEDYDGLKDKRITISGLIKERIKYLDQLGVKFLIDPFDRIKINEQLEIINLLGHNLENVLNIKDRIKVIVDSIEEAQVKNNELFILINQDVSFVDDTTSMFELVQDFEKDTQIAQIPELAGDYYNEKVVNIRESSGNFNDDIIREKTKGVISRVYEMLTAVNVNTLEEKSVVPELTIEKGDIFEDAKLGQEIFEEVPLKDKNDFEDNKVVTKNENLFQNLEPFEKTVLFTDRYDDNVFETEEKNHNIDDKSISESQMPDLFWLSDNESSENASSNEDVNNELSFDEQIEKLINDDSSKVKKLVA